MKKIISFILMGCLLLSLIACGNESKKNEIKGNLSNEIDKIIQDGSNGIVDGIMDGIGNEIEDTVKDTVDKAGDKIKDIENDIKNTPTITGTEVSNLDTYTVYLSNYSGVEEQPYPEFNLDSDYELYAVSGLYDYTYPAVGLKVGSTKYIGSKVSSSGKGLRVELKTENTGYNYYTLETTIYNNDGHDISFIDSVIDDWSGSDFKGNNFQKNYNARVEIEGSIKENSHCYKYINGEDAILFYDVYRVSETGTIYRYVDVAFYKDYHGDYAYMKTEAYKDFVLSANTDEELNLLYNEVVDIINDLMAQYGIPSLNDTVFSNSEYVENYV